MFLLALAALVFVVAYFIVRFYLDSRYLPPGPFPLPVIGNLHLLSSKPYLDFYRLARRYGPVYRLNMGCNLVVVINNYNNAKEAMLKKGSDFAGRPSHFVGSLFSRNGKGVGFQTFSKTFRKQHKAISSKINEQRRKEPRLEVMVAKEVDELIQRMRSNETDSYFDPSGGVTFAFANIVTTLALGKRYRDDDSEFLALMDALTIFVEGLAATNFIDTFPFLKFVPFNIIKKVRNAVDVRDAILNRIYLEHKAKLQDKTNANDAEGCPPDLTDYLIKIDNNEMTEDHIVMTMNDTIMAGSETPTMNFLWIMYYLTKYPDVQEKIHRELDDVIGTRAPEWSERQELPYLKAFIAEVLRHCSVMPLAIPHEALCDSTIGLYHVPKGTTVLLNIYAIHHDPEVWENPKEFKPERFLDENRNFDSGRAANLIAFGIGHRVCPGEALARMESFLFTTRFVKSFKLKGDGEVMPDVNECSFGITLRPPPFRVRLIPRDC
ncbi:steroid 17-alpha-hydroxylase/17,20 lyase-like [Actinia tenebrosa]|uniref:Steroid 21-hydroxylase n=1 Tax=Actinia tenebrosa TaxID=6105 RepID=A0A6P8HG98_ACTTE|nr:steroid 17-alpha-hydroxylase/17,20 lyase-like [Actinia tenebrosa]